MTDGRYSRQAGVAVYIRHISAGVGRNGTSDAAAAAAAARNCITIRSPSGTRQSRRVPSRHVTCPILLPVGDRPPSWDGRRRAFPLRRIVGAKDGVAYTHGPCSQQRLLIETAAGLGACSTSLISHHRI